MKRTVWSLGALGVLAFLIGAALAQDRRPVQEQGGQRRAVPPATGQPRPVDQAPGARDQRRPVDEGRTGDDRMSDQTFAMKAATGGMMEVKLGRLAMEQAQNEDVRRFAKRMVDDHSRANEKLRDLLRDRQPAVSLPRDMTQEHREVWDKLKGLRGEEFDRAYMKQMVKDHEEDLPMFEREAKNGQDDTLRSFASKTLPTLREHLEMARDIAKKVRGDDR